MKKIITLFAVLVLACTISTQAKPGIDSLFKAHQLRGSFVLLDYTKDKYTIFNEARCRKRFLPASTFKIPNSLIALELGIVKDTNHLFKWDSIPRRMPIWNKDMNIAEAMRLSCVPCYQEIAKSIGEDRMKQWVEKLNYGNKDISGGIDQFWLNGDLKISQMEQIEFLKNFYFNMLSAKKKNIDIVKSLLVKEVNSKYKISGKTGTAMVDKLYGWYVGYLEKSGNVYFFALNIEAKLPTENSLLQERIDLTNDILKYLKLID